MKANLLSPDKDPMGAAITDYFHHQKAGKLRVFSSQFEEDEIPINQLFRSFDEMSEPEKTALQMASGKILDAGAGSGCHTLALQEMGKEVCAIDISPLSVKVMAERGVRDVRQINLFDVGFLETFDTHPDADEWFGHHREIRKYARFLSENETIASSGRMYFNGFERPALSFRGRRRQLPDRPCRRLLWRN